jgi:hypothetical protein
MNADLWVIVMDYAGCRSDGFEWLSRSPKLINKWISKNITWNGDCASHAYSIDDMPYICKKDEKQTEYQWPKGMKGYPWYIRQIHTTNMCIYDWSEGLRYGTSLEGVVCSKFKINPDGSQGEQIMSLTWTSKMVYEEVYRNGIHINTFKWDAVDTRAPKLDKSKIPPIKECWAWFFDPEPIVPKWMQSDSR